uniref:C2H2-type domain-containing protein n=1 Tax=Arion vulgaris TaxID=1028688 RepID=A0A0B6Z2L7_9EUPU
MVIHSEDKPFKCSRCHYTCKLKNLLDSHTRIMHTSLKPYSCMQCTYTTKTASNLKKHMWIHEQYRPFECRFCAYTAREKNKLRRHETLKHKDMMVEKPEVKPALNTDILETYNIIFTSQK